MNMKYNLIASATVGLLALLHASTTAATDIKAHHGSECKVYGTTAWTDLGFGWQGIFNTTNASKVIVCPLVKDSEVDWDGDDVAPVNAAYVDVHYRAPGPASSISCTAYVNRTTGLTSSKSIAVAIPAGSQDNANIEALQSNGTPNDLGAIRICNLGAKAVLQHYRLVEPAATDG